MLLKTYRTTRNHRYVRWWWTKKERLSNSIVGGNHFNAVTGFLCEETFLLTDSEDYADEELGS